jgi:metallo-beta-lactamase family protein
MTEHASVSFFGAVDAVTGSNFLFTAKGKRVMIDCGLFQGDRFADERNHEKFPFEPASIDILLVTHAHIDHIGRIPKLVREGFRGAIYSTPPTHDLTELMLMDTVRILAKEATLDGRPPIYEEGDVRETMKLWKTHEYYKPFELIEGLTCEFKDAGHILGSAMMFLTMNAKTIVFTGDLGNSPAPLLRDTDPVTGVTYLLMESVYGDRNHEDRDLRKAKLQQAVTESVAKGGVLLIPAFSIERTQDLLFELNDMVEHHHIPSVPIFLDSPLAIKATEIYKHYEQYFNKETQHIIKGGDDIFRFPRLAFTERKEESMAIWDVKGPKVIIAGSGMANGGRIVHHLKHYLGQKTTTVLLVGYQAAGTPGRRMAEGATSIRLNGDDVHIAARVTELHGYSAHKDSDHLVEFAETGIDTLKKVFVAIGEPKASMFLTQRLRDELGLDAMVPEPGTSIDLEF